MALRNIRVGDDDILRKKCKEVKVFDKRLEQLLDDMAETMYDHDGVGLAAPQVGILKKIVVIDIGEGLVELINPVILDSKGAQIDDEACLSVPGYVGKVKRPKWVKIECNTRDGGKMVMEGEDLMARCICHEVDHLEGILYPDKVIGGLREAEEE